jgi:hypothetical protein
MLYQVATGLLSEDEISSPLRSIFSHRKNVHILLDEVTGVDPDVTLHSNRGKSNLGPSYCNQIAEISATLYSNRGPEFRAGTLHKPNLSGWSA